MSCGVARTDILFHRAGAIWLLVDPITDKVHSLNPSAYWLWYQCDGQAGAEQLAVLLAEEAGIPLERARADVAAGLEELARKNLIVTGG